MTSLSALPPISSTQNPPPHATPDDRARIGPHHSNSPTPILRSSVQPSSPSQSLKNPSSHVDQVDKVSTSLDDDGMEEDNSQDEDYFDEESDDEI